MNARFQHSPLVLSAALLAAQAFVPVPAAHAGQPTTLPPVQAVRYLVDCSAPRSLPSQREVGEWTGEHNFYRVFQIRARLMTDVTRACRKPGIERVQLVHQATAAPGHGRETILAGR